MHVSIQIYHLDRRLFDLRGKYEKHGSVMDTEGSERLRSAQINEMHVCLLVTGSPRKSIVSLVFKLHIARISMLSTVYKQKFVYGVYIKGYLKMTYRRIRFYKIMAEQNT